MRELLLYTTVGCHLCEQAQQMLVPVLDYINRGGIGNEQSLEVRPVEISDSPELMLRYGVRIPVIRLQDAESELGWPFDQTQVFEFLSRQLALLP